MPNHMEKGLTFGNGLLDIQIIMWLPYPSLKWNFIAPKSLVGGPFTIVNLS